MRPFRRDGRLRRRSLRPAGVWLRAAQSRISGTGSRLITTLGSTQTGAIFPKPDSAKTLGQNAYELHHAGLNWFDIAQAYGWQQTFDRLPGEPKFMYVNKGTGERASWGKSIGRIKSAYTAEVKARGETPLRIPPAGSHNFRLNAVQGYLNEINSRLRQISGQRGAGTELVLADKTQNVTAAIAEDFPEMRHNKARRPTYNAEAYRRGVNHARTASLNPEAGAKTKQALS